MATGGTPFEKVNSYNSHSFIKFIILIHSLNSYNSHSFINNPLGCILSKFTEAVSWYFCCFSVITG